MDEFDIGDRCTLNETDRRLVRERVREFNIAWLQRPEPALDAYLPDPGSSIRSATLLQLIEADLKFRWRSALGALTESYLQRWHELPRSQQVTAALLKAECLARAIYHREPTEEELQRRFPGSAANIDLASIIDQARELQTRESMDRNGRYFLLRKAGQGGMGIVYEALDRQRNQRVAIKIMPQMKPKRLYYFKREFRALAEVVHPNLASMYELHAESDRWFLTMEFVDGVDFRSFVQTNLAVLAAGGGCFADTSTKQSPSVYEAETEQSCGESLEQPLFGPTTRVRDFEGLRELLLQLADGVSALHRAGILHRDLKPSNVMVQPDGQLKILDFGLVTQLKSPISELDSGSPDVTGGDSGDRFGTDLAIVGTFAYMSPEQMLGEVLTERSDWYAVGLMLFESLTGRPPFVGSREQIVQRKLADHAPSAKSFGDIPDDLSELCSGLLARDPRVRAGASTIRRVLQRPTAAGGRISGPHASSAPANIPFVGRSDSLDRLSAALRHVEDGGAATVHVSGPSGAGKTRLVEHFLSTFAQQRDALVLSGRCYENESVPYKALDALVDALGMFLVQQSPARLEHWLPAGVGSLAVMFPVLNRVEPIASASRERTGSYDVSELRRQAFAAMRELLFRISKTRPLVLFIDDLQWGDSDSAGVLSELIRPPNPPRLLLIAGYRNERLESNACVQVLVEEGGQLGIDSWTVDVRSLSEDESEQLASLLMGPDHRPALGKWIAKESSGTPFLIIELAQHVESRLDLRHGMPSTQVELDEVLWNRARELPRAARDLLEVIALSGRPLRIQHALQGAALDLRDQDALAYLRAGHFVQGHGPALDDEIGIYHDRIRESIISHLSGEQKRRHHAGLAATFEAADDVDPERIADHFVGAGQLARAGSYFAVAADQAANALAFNRAARLYRTALEHMPLDEQDRRAMQIKLADALANSGRGVQAARTYQASIEGATQRESLELERKAAFQYCISGYVDDGRAALDRVLRQIGLGLPTTPTGALASLLASRCRLRLRGLRFRPRSPEDIPKRDLDRIDSIWSAAAGLSMFDVLQGADFQTRHCLLALKCGEPFRLARALAWEGAHLSNIGGSSWRRARRFLDLAKSLSDQVDDPYAIGFWELSSGIAEFTNGRWASAHERLTQAQTTLRENCFNVAWEIGTAQAFDMWTLVYMGRIAEMGREATALTREARERGDLYAETTHRAFAQPVGLLAKGDVDHCFDLVHSALDDWTRVGFHVQHIVALMCMTYLDLYRGRHELAYTRMQEQWTLAKNSHLLRVQILRTFLTHLRARCAIAYAGESGNSPRLFKDAARDAKRIARENMPYCRPHSQHILAAIAAHQGDQARALQLLDEAIQGYQQCEMELFATVVKYRKGELLGGTDGRQLIDAATRWMEQHEIVDCDRMCDAFAARMIP